MANNNGKGRSQKRSGSRRPNYKPNVKKVTATDVTLSTNGISHNDPDWYIYDPVMFEGVISMPTFEIKGESPITALINDQDGEHVSLTEATYRFPNVLAYNMNPSPGWSPNADSPINLQGRKMYAQLSASNAKNSNYGPEDTTICILALGQIIAMIEHLRRAYGTVNYFNFFNRSVPGALISAMHLDYDVMRTKLADVRAKINTLISRVDTIQFPADLAYFKQCDYIYKNIFVDRDDKMPTYHFMNPDSTWILREDLSEEGSVLETETLHDLTGIDDLIQRVDDMITAVLTSSTFNYIFADVVNLINRNVYSSNTISIEPVAIDYTITPLYSEQFNWQIMNMHILGRPLSDVADGYTKSNNVYAITDSLSIKYKPEFAVDTSVGTAPIPVRIPDINISHNEFVECLAYFCPYTVTKRGDVICAKDVALATYYCSTVTVIYPNPDGTTVGWFECNSNVKMPNWWMSGTTIPRLSWITEPIHTPYFGFAHPSQKLIVPLVKVGSFTQVGYHALENLRYQTTLALFKIK